MVEFLKAVFQDWQSGLFWCICSILFPWLIAGITGRRQELRYKKMSTTLITHKESQIPGIQITLDGTPVDNLVSTTVTFLNSGNQNIEPGDFRASSPLCLSTTDGHFLGGAHGYKVVAESPNVSSKPTLSDDMQTLSIQFDCLKPKEAVSVSVLHNGVLSVGGELRRGAITKKEYKINTVRDVVASTVRYAIILYLFYDNFLYDVYEYASKQRLVIVCCMLSVMSKAIINLTEYFNSRRFDPDVINKDRKNEPAKN